MSDQRRLLDDEQTRGLAQQLLRAGASVRLSEQRKSEVWARIASRLPPTGGSGASEPPPAAPTGTTGPLFSVTTKLGVALGVGALWVGAWFAGTSLARRPPAAPPPAMSVLPPTPAEQRPEMPPAPSAVVRPEVSAILPAPTLPRSPKTAVAEPSTPEPPGEPEAPAPSASGGVAPVAPASPEEIARQERINLLRREVAMTREARGALRAGNAAEALRLLEGIQQKFGGRGQLQEEREALTIEALGRAGRRDEARALANAFLGAHPSSPFAQEVQSFSQ